MSVSSADLARNLGNMSAAMSVGGNTMEESIGLLTGITEITRSAASASRALVTIQSRFNQIVDESSSTGQNLLKWYTKHGIAVKDDAGQLRSLYDVMSDLAPKWNSLTKNEQSYFMQQQAGARQSQNLAALLSNFKGVQEATALAYDSSGSAAAENAKVLESLDTKTTALKATWEDFANKTIDSELVKSLLNLANGALKILNTGVGRTITQFTLLSGVFVGLGGVIARVAPGIIAGFTGMSIKAAAASASMKALSASVPIVGVALAALSVALIQINKEVEANKRLWEEINAPAENLRNSMESLANTESEAKKSAEAQALEGERLLAVLKNLDTVTEKDSVQTRRYKETVDALNKLYPDLNLHIDQYTGKISESTETIKTAIEKTKQLAIVQAASERTSAAYSKYAEASVDRMSIETQVRELLAKIKAESKGAYISDTGYALFEGNVDTADFEDIVSYVDRVLSRVSQFTKQSDDEHTVWKLVESWKAYGVALDEAQIEIQNLEKIKNELYKSVEEEDKSTNKTTNTQVIARKTIDDLKASYEALDEAIKEYTEWNGLSSDTIALLDDQFPNLSKKLYDADGNLTDIGKNALSTSKKLADFAVAQKEAEIRTQQATLEFIRQATALDLIRFEGIMPSEGDLEAQIKKAEGELDYLKLLQELAAQKEAADADKSSKRASSTTEAYKKAFTDWLAYKDHQLAMDEITEEQYYAELTEMVDKFFKGRAEYQEEYWQYSEKIYAYEKKRMQELVEESTKAVEDAVDKINEKYDSELSRLEEVNDALSDQIEYEKLLDEMAKAREQKKLVYKDGRFQYVQDVDAISAAQAKIDEYNRNKGLEASKADIEARRKAEVRQTILDKMQANSAAWATSSSPAEREALHNANVELAKLLEDNSTYDAATGKWSSYAGGTLGATGGMSLVGENGPEMRILNRGDGILTSGITKNLFAWGSTSPSDFVSALKGLMGFKLGNSSNTTVNVNNLELPNVTNAREFVTGLKNLALQYAYERG